VCEFEFSVSDTGIGIPADHRARLFEPFTRLERDQRVPGLGLGLAIVQQLVRAMGGQVAVDSSQGEPHGSRFTFRLQLPIGAPLGGEAESAAPITGYHGRRRTLLIADDFPTSRRYLADCCAAWGFDVVLAEDGGQALDQLRSAQPTVDAALVDQFMPQLDGWGFLRRVREFEPTADLPVVLISAAPLQRPAAFPPELEFDAYAMKPLSEARLAQILEDLLGIDWEYADAPPAPGDRFADPQARSTSIATACSTEELAQFRDMVAFGKLMAIQRWARTMADQRPEHAALWQDLAQLCTSVDLPALRRIADDGRPTASTPSVATP
jgi:CheY-like chemotaxis protein